MRSTFRNQRLFAGLMMLSGALLALAVLSLAGGHSAHGQANGSPNRGLGTGGIPAVLLTLEEMEAALHARLDDIDAELAEIRETVTPQPFDATVDICFELTGGFAASAGVGLEHSWGLGSSVGLDFYGNGVTLQIPPILPGFVPLPSGLGGEAGAEAGGSAEASMTICFSVPVSSLIELTGEQEDMAEAMQVAAEILRERLVDVLGNLGFNATTVQSNVTTACDLLESFPSSDVHVLNTLQDGAGQLVDLIDVLPLNAELKGQVIEFANMQVVPADVPNLDVCDFGDLENAPAAFLPIINLICSRQQIGLDLVDTLNTLNSVNQALEFIVQGIEAIVCFLDPDCPE